ISTIEKGKVHPVQPIERTKNLITSSVIIDRKNRVWVATVGKGVLKFENGSCSSVTTKQGLVSNYTSALMEDAYGNIWIGTDGNGISILSDTGVVSLSTKDGLSSNFIHSFYQDRDSTVWIGTFGGGLNLYNKGKIASITTQQGLFDDVIFQILEDNYGRIWMTSNKGIFHVNKNELHQCADKMIAKVTSVAYGKENGLKSTECNGGVQPAGWKAHDGSLWIPTEAGLATVDPKSISVNRQPPLVVIEDFLVDNKSVPMSDNLVISPSKDRFEIHFTGLSFLSPKKVHFKVKLEGYDKIWEDLGTRRTAYYTNLPAGVYTFRVLAANSDGVWNTDGASFTFTREGYFYETTLFYFVLIVLFMVSVYILYRIRVRSIRHRQHQLERLINDSTKDLREEQEKTKRLLEETEHQKVTAENANMMKSQLLDMVAHHLKSPLISITGLTKEVEQSASLNAFALKYLKMIRFGADRMVAIINDLLSLSAIESGEITFHMEKINFAEIAAIIIDGYKFHAQTKEQILTFVSDDSDDVTVFVDPLRMQEAIENLISNAIKYSPSHTVIRSGVYRHNSVVRFWVTDSGPGLSEQDKQLLFKKFQILSAKPTGGEVATGLGLAIVKEIVEIHKGRVYVESENSGGSTFVIELTAVSVG
ncbi:MAG: two-component regulator propeller domain-containing protein, partial [Bacteroidota bacterium]|nr:two-component regulator propeller domain-containing protein [Bacteroidota bacterium]